MGLPGYGLPTESLSLIPASPRSYNMTGMKQLTVCGLVSKHLPTRQDLSPKKVRVRDGRRGQVGVGAFAQLDYFLFADHSDGAP